ncbi:Tigger transposable element-derived protein 6 [Araneus ventricosus]|uniref:Tigger transposable element-derived protein 6 n=1 Tax=Araneus ventricosus TaxID=182803 RepID=A0A4Y2JAZ8_ARAVE|nr:Tigger transposable element-derived protein 6 [Araneus ventricosus]
MSVNEGAVEQWKEDLATLVNRYEPKNIYNCVETGLFYKLMPDRTLPFKGKPCNGGKKSKGRLTVLLCCNADGLEKFPPLVIGR